MSLVFTFAFCIFNFAFTMCLWPTESFITVGNMT
jgi:hypothetical protein